MKEKIFALFKSIVVASLFAFLLYFILAFSLAALFENNPNKDLYISCCMVLIYDLSYYVIHERRRKETFAECDEQFTYGKELKAYFAAEGRYLLLLYGLCALAIEIGMLVSPEGFNRSIGVIFAMVYPLTPYIPIPIVRTVSGLVICMGGAVVLMLLRSSRIKKTLHK